MASDKGSLRRTIHDPEQAVPLGGCVAERDINPASLEGGRIALVVHTHDRLFDRLFGSGVCHEAASAAQRRSTTRRAFVGALAGIKLGC
jgi:hypothetical protein